MIAEVQADLTGHGITVETHESFDIYQSTKKIEISGNGFVDGVKVNNCPVHRIISRDLYSYGVRIAS